MKKLILFAGVNGAGKSTLFNIFEELADMERINVDEIVKTIGKWDNAKDVMEAGKIAVKKQRDLVTQGESFNQETTLCGKSIVALLQRAKGEGYSIEVFYVGVSSVDIAIDRVKERVKNGGHGVPEADIKRRYNESIDNIISVMEICDKIELFDNTNEFLRIAVYQKGKWKKKVDDIPAWAERIIGSE